MTSVDEAAYANDSKYKSYVSQMEKCLKAFEYTAEWADLIAALGRLIRVLQQFAKFPVIPRKDVVGKRLAQCLHPALPAGVHLKALECYDSIFRNIGPQKLAADLFNYCTGLFPLLGASAMTVKPPLMDIYESHFLPLGVALKPAFVGLLQGLLPGLEEGAEFFERANSLMERFCEAVEPSFFYTSLWQVMLQAPSVRQFGISFITAHYNRRTSTEDQLFIIGNNVNLMLVSLCSLLGDSSVLVQRQSLEFVLLALPIHNSQLTQDDLVTLCAATLGVLLRRDMSLNRRLYSWLLGNNLSLTVLTEQLQLSASEAPSGQSLNSLEDSATRQLYAAYFHRYGRTLLIKALTRVIRQPGANPRDRIQSIRPFRVMTSLLDKQEVGSQVIEAVLLDLLIYMRAEYQLLGQHAEDAAAAKTQQEFLKTASLFFSNLESVFLWGFLTGLFRQVCARLGRAPQNVEGNAMDQLRLTELCDLMQFMLDRLPIETYSDVNNIHLPHLLSSVTALMVEHTGRFSKTELQLLLTTYRKIFCQILRHASMAMEVEMKSDSISLASFNSGRASLADPPRTPSSPAPEANSRPMEQAIEQFRQFFFNFCHDKLGFSAAQEADCMAQVEASRGKEGPGRRAFHCTDFERLRLRAVCLDAAGLSCFADICQLLVEMTSYPIYSSSPANQAAAAQRGSNPSVFFADHDENEPPPKWFTCLAVAACFADNFFVKSVAVATVIDLIHATRSVHGTDGCDFDASLKSDRVAVVVFPTLPPRLLHHLSRKTHFYECVGRSLWAFLAPTRPQCHQKAVELLYRLHQVCPNANLCEDIILSEMLSENLSRALDAHRRFIVLWHLLRSTEEKTGNRGPGARTFDKCMFVLLDSLDHPDDGARRSLARSWLAHALQTGQCAAILEPLLLRLLQPDTARVSILHLNTSAGSEAAASVAAAAAANRLKEEAEAERLANEQERRIYAISSEGGRVVFHVRPPAPMPNQTKDNSSEARNGDRAPVAVVQSLDRRRVQRGTDSTPELPFERVSAESVNLRINPFDEEEEEKVSETDETNSGRNTSEVLQAAEARRSERIAALREAEQPSNAQESALIVESLIEDLLAEVTRDTENAELRDASSLEALPAAQRPTSFPDFEAIRPTTLRGTSEGFLLDEMSSVPRLGTPAGPSADDSSVLALHGHLLMYCQRYDANRMLYILSRVKALLRASPCLFVTALATTSVTGGRQSGGASGSRGSGSSPSSYSQLIQNLLARQRKALFGKNFYQDVTSEEFAPFRAVMFLEIVVTVCSYFLRGVYPQLAATPLEARDLYENKMVQCVAAEILESIFCEVIDRIKQRGKDFRSYVKDISAKCKLQRVVLHCLASSVHAMLQRPSLAIQSFSEAMVAYNEDSVDVHVRNSYQTLLLQLTLTCMRLDEQLFDDPGPLGTRRGTKLLASYEPPTARPTKDLAVVKFTQGAPLSHQSMLLTCVVAALRPDDVTARHMHAYWYHFLLSSLPHWGRASAAALVPEVRKLCKILAAIANVYANERKRGRDMYLDGVGCLPPDYCLSTMECLQGICHHTLLDSGASISMSGENASDQSLFWSIFGKARDGPALGSTPREIPDWLLEARTQVLRLMPRLLVSLALLWQKAELSACEESAGAEQQPAWIMGRPHLIRKAVLDLLSPLAVNHCSCLLAALAVVWSEQAAAAGDSGGVVAMTECPPEQVCLVDICAALRSLPMDTLLSTIREIIRRPPPTPQTSETRLVAGHGPLVSVSLLHFLLVYIRRLTGPQLAAVWTTLLSLFKECLTVTVPPQGYFIMLKILSEFVSKVPPFEDRREQREVQDLCQKLLEAVAAVAGGSLEQATWFRRALQVKTGEETINSSPLPLPDSTSASPSVHASQDLINGSRDLSPNVAEASISKSKMQSVHALNLLAEHIASMLDVVYKSEEKERVSPFLSSSILTNVFPYLRHHSLSNLASARACTRLLAALSSYQYTRRAWRKEVFDLFLEQTFFQLDNVCLGHWKSIIDNLLTQDKATLKEMMARLVLTQPGGLNIFTSKEQEYEQGALMMRKLAFLIFASEPDQYVKSMPEIQERLNDCLRMGEASPVLQAQAFFCFRVLVVRMSPQHLTSLWHIFMPELVTVLRRVHEDVIANTIGGNGNRSSRRFVQTLGLYMSACKLLDLALVLPEDQVPQFLFYKWSFVGDHEACSVDRSRSYQALLPVFVPIVSQLVSSLLKRASDARSEEAASRNVPLLRLARADLDARRPLLSVKSVSCLEDLFPFFAALYLRHNLDAEHRMTQLGIAVSDSQTPQFGFLPPSSSSSSSPLGADTAEWHLSEALEQIFQAELLDPMPK